MRSGRGRQNPVKINELGLIREVQKKHILYDKSATDYRKPGVTENAWAQVADALKTKVEFCKKRWKSLRDTYIKYLRFEIQSENDGVQCGKKHKSWVYYENLNFLKQHVDLFRLTDGGDGKFKLEDKHEQIDNHYSITDDNGKIKYEIEITEDDSGMNTYGEMLEEEDDEGEEDAIFEVQNDSHEQLDDEPTYYIENEESLGTYIVDNQSATPKNEKNEILEPEEHDQKSHKDLLVLNNESNPSHSSSTKSNKANAIDPDERYLLSCLPAFKRFSPKQKAYVRMGIEKLFYEVEFGDEFQPQRKQPKYS